MEAKLQKWGNSTGIRIPSNLLKSLNLNCNDKINIEQEEDKIIISKQKRSHLTIEERIEKFGEYPEDEKGSIEPYDWGEDKGKEKFY